MMSFLIKLRKKHKISSTDMANKLGISKTFYWQIEHGERRLSYEMAVKISNLFNLKPDDIFYKDYIKMMKKQS
ncbi:MAG: helix-turn-helix transcriptional regulator [Bacilli bacterium]|nr:helix-turn-helix transcriptional regulator [Bacilli bacterium]